MVTFSLKIVENGIAEIHASRPGYSGEAIEIDIDKETQEWLLKMGAYSLLEETE